MKGLIEMMAYLLLIFTRSFVKFRLLDPKIKMKRPKRDMHSAYLLTYLHIYILTDYPSHRISYELIQFFFAYYCILNMKMKSKHVCFILKANFFKFPFGINK